MHKTAQRQTATEQKTAERWVWARRAGRGVSFMRKHRFAALREKCFDAVTPSTPPPFPNPSSSPPISHLMWGGCWEPHAKMNNNRPLVTIAHEHTRCLSLCRSCLSAVFFLTFLCFSLTHGNSSFSVIYEHIEIQFRPSVSLSLDTHHRATLTFGLKVIPHIPLFHAALVTLYQRSQETESGENMYACLCWYSRRRKPQTTPCLWCRNSSSSYQHTQPTNVTGLIPVYAETNGQEAPFEKAQNWMIGFI